MKDLKVGTVKTGKIVKSTSYGVFVDINAKRSGLLHVTNITSVVGFYIDGLKGQDVYREAGCGIGDEVKVEIIQVKGDQKFELGLVESDVRRDYEDSRDYESDEGDEVDGGKDVPHTPHATDDEEDNEDDMDDENEYDDDYDEDDDIEDTFGF